MLLDMIKRLSSETYGSDPGIFRSGGPATERMTNYYNSSGDPMITPKYIHPSLAGTVQQLLDAPDTAGDAKSKKFGEGLRTQVDPVAQIYHYLMMQRQQPDISSLIRMIQTGASSPNLGFAERQR